MIERRENDTSRNVVMTACPFCGHEFQRHSPRRAAHLTDCPDAPV